MPPNQPEGNLRGEKTQIPPRANARHQHKLERENETAELLAQSGYDVEQNPPPLPNGKKPDYIINGEVFDCYTPSSSNPNQIRKGISRKVRKEQASRIVLNLDESGVSLEDWEQTLTNNKINDLKEMILVTNQEVKRYLWQ